MHVGSLAGYTPGQVLINPRGTNFGNLPNGGGLARALSGTPSLTASFWSDSGNTAFDDYSQPACGIVGKLWPAPVTLARVKAWSSASGWDRASQAATITLKFQGSADTTTGLDGTWADLLVDSMADSWGSQIIRDLAVPVLTPYKAHRLCIYSSYSLSFQCNGLQFYAYSWI